jgi:major membrane immunogen (membrane-anchored lipoprotein)
MLEWNMNIHESKWVNWIVFFLLFAIVPAYGIVFGLVDAIVLNSIEFWTGTTMFAEKTMPDGTRVVTEATSDENVAQMTVTSRDGEVLAMYYVERHDEDIRVLDERGQTLAHVGGVGRPTLRDGRGRRVARLERTHVQRVLAAGRRGDSMAAVAWDCLEDSGQDQPMLAFGARLDGRARI